MVIFLTLIQYVQTVVYYYSVMYVLKIIHVQLHQMPIFKCTTFDILVLV